MPVDDKARENRLRNMAARRGLRLVKAPRRDPYALEFGTYGLIHAATSAWVLADKDHGYGCDLDEIEAWLKGKHPTQLAKSPHRSGRP